MGAGNNDAPRASDESFDDIVRDLQSLRDTAGGVSYAEIARRIASAREERGVAAAAARVARTTVYDAFRPGRARIDARLIGEIATALGATSAESEGWTTRARGARRGEPDVEGDRPRAQALPSASDGAMPPREQRAPRERLAPHPALPTSAGFVIVLMIVGVAVNVTGAALGTWLELPLYLDMVGTAVVAIALGPWRGSAVAVASSVAFVPITSAENLPYMLVNIAGALVWGFGVHRFALGRSLRRFFALNLLVGIVCALIGAVLTLTLFGGDLGYTTEDMADRYTSMGALPALAVLAAIAIVSVADKLLCGFIALAFIAALHARIHPPLAPGLVDLPVDRQAEPRVAVGDSVKS